MLRGLFVLLVLLNALLAAFTLGWLPALDGQSGSPSSGEPERLAQQIRPEALRLAKEPKTEPPAAAGSEPAAASTPVLAASSASAPQAAPATPAPISAAPATGSASAAVSSVPAPQWRPARPTPDQSLGAVPAQPVPAAQPSGMSAPAGIAAPSSPQSAGAAAQAQQPPKP